MLCDPSLRSWVEGSGQRGEGSGRLLPQASNLDNGRAVTQRWWWGVSGLQSLLGDEGGALEAVFMPPHLPPRSDRHPFPHPHGVAVHRAWATFTFLQPPAYPSLSFCCAEKKGSCPKLDFLQLGICHDTCAEDSQCPGQMKCCLNGCGKVSCVTPTF